MKKQFFDFLFELMKTNKDIVIIFVGLGYPRLDEFLREYPDRAFNTEASEQTALDIAVGLSYAGKTPFVYTITTFYWRAAETIRTYLNHEKLPCVLIGAGREEEYGKEDGFSHSATDIKELFNLFKNFNQYYPDTKEEMESDIIEAIESKKPSFVNIHK
jgi:transketolase C-terminal domain/subunit